MACLSARQVISHPEKPVDTSEETFNRKAYGILSERKHFKDYWCIFLEIKRIFARGLRDCLRVKLPSDERDKCLQGLRRDEKSRGPNFDTKKVGGQNLAQHNELPHKGTICKKVGAQPPDPHHWRAWS